MVRKIQAHVRPNGHEGYIVEIEAPHLGPARIPMRVCKPNVDGVTPHRYAMAEAREAAKAYRDGFNSAVGIVAAEIHALAVD